MPFCQSGTPNCDADYVYEQRPDRVHEAMDRIELTGDIRRPMLTLHGTYDTLLPIRTDSDVYDQMVERQGHGRMHRYYRFVAGNHVDGLYGTYGDRIRPLLPCARRAFVRLTDWVQQSVTPPPNATLPKPTRAGYDTVNRCSLR